MTNTRSTEASGYEVKELRKLNILLAEDNLLNSKLVSLLFLQNGLTLQTAADGAEAVNKIKTTHFDIILMDMEMPVLNGYQATIMIRKQLKNNVPIIAMTAHTMPGERKRCLQLGMNDYISKPVNEECLFRAIYNLTRSDKRIGKKESMAISAKTFPFTEKVCKLDYLIHVTHGNKESMNSILDVFLEETPKELSILDEAIKKTNYVLISYISHKIRSSFSILGIAVLNRILEEIEQLGSISSGIERITQLNRRAHVIFLKAIQEMKVQTGKA